MVKRVVCTVGLTKNGSGKFRLTVKALQAVAFYCTMITSAVGTWVKLGRGGRLAGACGGTDVVGIDGKWLFECAFLAVIVVSVVKCPGGAAFNW